MSVHVVILVMVVLINAQTCVNLFVVLAHQVVLDVRVRVLKVAQKRVQGTVEVNVFPHVIFNAKTDVILHVKPRVVEHVTRDVPELVKVLQILPLHIHLHRVQIVTFYAIQVAKLDALIHAVEIVKILPPLVVIIQ